MTDGISSGAVPREPFPGIVWDDAAEVAWREVFNAWCECFPAIAAEERALEQAKDSARWHIELGLITATIRREVEAARRLDETVAKLQLRDDWRARYGWQLAETLLRVAKSPDRYGVYLS